MITPRQLYNSYTENPCTYDFESGSSIGAGSPYNLAELSVFLKQVKYPCIERASGFNTLYDGSGQLVLPYKYLEVLDPLCFTEIQPSIEAGTAHAVRNAADVARACNLLTRSNPNDTNSLFSEITLDSAKKWIARGATEHMTALASNSIAKCLFVLGPSLTAIDTSASRGTGCDDMDCLPAWKPGKGSALGAGFGCVEKKEGTGKECSPCQECDPNNDTDPCCTASTCAEKVNLCCGDPPGGSGKYDLSFYPKFPFAQFNYAYFPSGRVTNGQKDSTIMHLGYLVRQQYKGYANLSDNTNNLWSCPKDLFVKYVQTKNNYNYITDTELNSNPTDPDIIQRLKLVSYVKNTDQIKKLLYNGYGVVLLSNIGFSDKKNSVGVSYPDKIWYHSYAIVGYDDTRTDSDQCLYIFANSWGDWNSGGNPSWGKLPVGCFMVTESHLKQMLNLERIERKGCLGNKTLSAEILGITSEPCTGDNDCIPWECDKKQTPMGYAFGLCFSEKYTARRINYNKFKSNKSHTNFPGKFQLSNKPGDALDLNDFFGNYSDKLTKFNNLTVNKVPENTENNSSLILIKNNNIYSNLNVANTHIQDLGFDKSPSEIVNDYKTGSSDVNFNFFENSGEYIIEKGRTIDYLSFNYPKPHYNDKFYHTKLISKSSGNILSENVVLNTLEATNLKLDSCNISFNYINTSIFECDSATLSSRQKTEYKKTNISCNIAYFKSTTIANNIFINADCICYLDSSSTNNGIIDSNTIINNSSNKGIINGDCYLANGSNNYSRINGNCMFENSNNAINEETMVSGVVSKNGYFKGSSINYGLVLGNAYFWKNAVNTGVVMGSVFQFDYE